MRVVFVTETYSEKMGYIQNVLPQALARHGVDTHLVTADLPSYHGTPEFDITYKDFLGTGQERVSTVLADGVTIHYLQSGTALGYTRLRGLRKKLAELRPDVVQCITAIGWIPLELAAARISLGFRLFTGSHRNASTFPLIKRQLSPWHPEMLKCYLLRTFPGWLASLATEECFAITHDAVEVAWRFFGVPRRKVVLAHLGVDLDTFHPPCTPEERAARQAVRRELGYTDHDIVCIYTGRFTHTKNPVILANAVGHLREQGVPASALFVGAGIQSADIQQKPFCTILPFKPFRELAPLYRAADIGVWPTDETISSNDAAACGLPLVVSDYIVDRDHAEGNGRIFRVNDLDDLVRVLRELADPAVRSALGARGAAKMREQYDWNLIARKRIEHYERALGNTR